MRALTKTIEQRCGGLADALNVGGTTLAPTGLPPDLLVDITRIAAPFTLYRTGW